MIVSAALGYPVKCMKNTFLKCSALTQIPNIPESVTDVYNVFGECSSLVSLPTDFTVPNGVTSMAYMFNGCSSLASLPAGFTIPNGITSVNNMFSRCSSLASLPAGFTIPSGVTSVSSMFSDCTLLTVDNLDNPLTIPGTVEEMQSTFSNCTSLTGMIVMNSTNIRDIEIYDEGYSGCFSGTTKPITLTTTAGVSTEILNKIAATAESGNVTVSVPQN